MTRTVFENAMVAHVWAQHSQDNGRSGNGNFFFQGRALYSYGSHYVAGFLLEPRRALVNAESYSISTTRHVSYARAACRYEDALPVANLTELARILSRVGAVEESGDKARRLRALARDVRKFFAQAGAATPPESIAAALRFCGVAPDKANAWAYDAHKAQEKAAQAAKDARAAGVALLRRNKAKTWAARPLEATREDLARALESVRKSGSADSAVSRIKLEALELHRAAQAAKERGWTRVAAQARAHRKAMLAAVPGLEEAARRFRRLERFKAQAQGVRKALASVRDVNATPETRARTAREALTFLAFLREGFTFNAAENRPNGFARRLRLMGGNAAETLARLDAVHGELSDALISATRAQRRAANLRHIRALRRFLALEENRGDATAEDMAKAARDAFNVANGMAPLRSFDGSSILVDRGPTPTWARFGFSADWFESIRDRAESARKRADLEAAAEALESWHAGGAWPRGLSRTVNGGALLRARDVKRDESGEITGGTLETSQGASVPLVHALRVFRVLKGVRGKGEREAAAGRMVHAWTPPRTLRVGHFTVDRVFGNGGFIAGCHRIEWPAVSDLARRLGVESLAACDVESCKAGA